MYKNFEEYAVYSGDDLGCIFNPLYSKFRLWSPTAEKVYLCLFKDNKKREIEMEKSENGTWFVEIKENLKNAFYTYNILRKGKFVETVDPYARALTANGTHGVVIDLKDTDPPGWSEDVKPPFDDPVDAVIYELHVRDFSFNKDSGIKNKGKYLAFTEKGSNYKGVKTGLDHLVELGITHVHLLPFQDFASVDELKGGYNWGYDPYHYFVPEGSYAVDPNDPLSRIKEVKEMILSLHRAGIRVVMDVVYNHTYSIFDSIFDKVEPGYFYRHNPDGSYSNGSGCGNETASERPMVKKLIIDSLKYWVKEYHVDGFRFDLMGLHDIDAMKEIEKILHSIDPSLLLYGEPWTAGPSVLPLEKQFLKGAQKGTRIAVFNDNFRNAIKGLPDDESKGFATGKKNVEKDIMKGVVGSIEYSSEIKDFALNPQETINYVSCHDNLTLWDKISKSNSEATEEEKILMDKLATMIIFTSQGIPFIHAGEEFLRTKRGNNNSYNAGDEINQLDWPRKLLYKEVFEYYQGLIKLRKEHPAFRMRTAEEIKSKLRFIKSPKNTIAFLISDNANNDPWGKIIVIYNPTKSKVDVKLPQGNWKVVVDNKKAGIFPIEKGDWTFSGNMLTVPPLSGMVLFS
ncbi:type I pullulanase [Thermoanaerobacter sp. YS13]|uniref:type I pullulanase n=1 Tax=Thermoanaerobacter sp. YS13 TaxID=1511746 RepID=UPI000A94119C|nr:type I pullulanase [Thermoanaerobacter sp. YS13]